VQITMAQPRRRSGNLPVEATSFVGRHRELGEVRSALVAARMVSLVGPGGVGKTRLAIRVAAELARLFRGGPWLVELAELRDPDLVPNAMMAALDLRDQASTEPLEVLLAHLREQEMLLVVDNCEHLLQASAGLLAEILKVAPGVRLVATSREPLSISGEHVVPVPPLALPAADGSETISQLRQNEAVALFSERAVAARGSFELTSSNQGAVAQICRRLDGIPMAIELAAVRTRVLSPEQILDRLGDRFALLTGGSRAALPRRQTLRATLDWSHDLLNAEERTLFRRLCVFAGGFSLEDVESVCVADGVPSTSLDSISSLVDKSLVNMEDKKGVAHYRLHETMREYALLKLREAKEEESAREEFVRHYIATCDRSVEEGSYYLADWLEWIESEIDNIRLVLQWLLLAKDFARGTALAGSAGWFWVARATTEGVRWLDEFLGVASIPTARTRWHVVWIERSSPMRALPHRRIRPLQPTDFGSEHVPLVPKSSQGQRCQPLRSTCALSLVQT